MCRLGVVCVRNLADSSRHAYVHRKSKWASPTEGAHFWQKISTVQVEYDGNDELRLLPGRKDAINSIVASIDHAKEEQERQQRLQS